MSGMSPQENSTSHDLPDPLADFGIGEDAVLLFDVSDRTQIELTGTDRARFLHGFCTNDIKRLTPGSGCEAFLTNIKGKAIGHIFVFATETSLWLDTVSGQTDVIVPSLDRYLIREDVQFVPHPDRCELFVTGRHAVSLLMLDEGLPAYGHVTRESFGHSFQIRRTDLFAAPGFLISLPRDAVASMTSSLRAVGCRLESNEFFESLRIATGFPRYGVDITDDNLVQEAARTKQAISFTKGCYLGQEPIARLDALGHTNRELRRMRFADGAQPAVGMRLVAGEDDDEAGVLTSVSPMKTNGHETYALGFLKTKHDKPGTELRAVPATTESVGNGMTHDGPCVGVVC